MILFPEAVTGHPDTFAGARERFHGRVPQNEQPQSLMKRKYKVTFYYHTSVEVEVSAENENDALAEAYLEVGKKKYDKALIHGLVEDGGPDIRES